MMARRIELSGTFVERGVLTGDALRLGPRRQAEGVRAIMRGGTGGRSRPTAAPAVLASVRPPASSRPAEVGADASALRDDRHSAILVEKERRVEGSGPRPLLS